MKGLSLRTHLLREESVNVPGSDPVTDGRTSRHAGKGVVGPQKGSVERSPWVPVRTETRFP